MSESETEQKFLKKVWEAIKGDHNDLRREQIILNAHREAVSEVLKSCEETRKLSEAFK